MAKKPTNAELLSANADLHRIIDTQQATVTQAGERERFAQAELRKLQTTSQSEFERLTKEANLKVSEVKGELNGLRDIIRKQELELARIRGYLDASFDAQPPRMVPEERERPTASFADMSVSEPRTTWANSGSRTSEKPWWHG